VGFEPTSGLLWPAGAASVLVWAAQELGAWW